MTARLPVSYCVFACAWQAIPSQMTMLLKQLRATSLSLAGVFLSALPGCAPVVLAACEIAATAIADAAIDEALYQAECVVDQLQKRQDFETLPREAARS